MRVGALGQRNVVHVVSGLKGAACVGERGHDGRGGSTGGQPSVGFVIGPGGHDIIEVEGQHGGVLPSMKSILMVSLSMLDV